MSTQPRNASIPIGPLVAVVGGTLLVVSLFLDWYEERTGFTVFEFIDLLLVLLALSTVVALASGLRLVRPAISPAASLALAVFALLVVLSQIVNHPPAAAGSPGQPKEIGIWLGLSGSALMAAGAVLGFAHISLAVEARPRTAATAPPRSSAAAPPPSAPAAGEDTDPTRPLSDRDEPPPGAGPERP